MSIYVKDILDNDQYKFTMQQAVCMLYPRAVVRYDFINRGNREFPVGFGSELKRIVDTFRDFALTKDGKNFLREKCYYFNPVYIDFLNGYRFDPTEVIIEQEGSVLKCYVQGPWYRTILWEPPLMAVISQLYFEMTGGTKLTRKQRKEINRKKAMALKELGVLVAEFTTRRRYSHENHNEVVIDFKKYGGNSFIGTSNLFMAMQHNETPIGTQAHEWFQFHAALFGFRMANEMAMKKWVDVYQGNLGIALPDTFTTDIFLRSFNSLYARQFDGMRHDSGDPIKFINKVVKHYKKLRIDPTSKTLVFSDGINNINTVSEIHNACKGVVKDAYGIGTWLGNDVGVHPLNMVIKMTGCYNDGEWLRTIKLSDDKGKNTGDKKTIELCKQILVVK